MITLGGVIGISSGRTRVVDADVLQAISVAAMIFSCSSDADWEVYIDKDLSDLPRPAAPTLTNSSTTLGQLAASQKVYVQVTAVDANGLEGPPSPGNKTITTGSGTSTNRVAASWTAVSGASSYNVYVGSRPGMETFSTNVAGATTCNIDMLPGDSAGGVPSAADILLSPARGEATQVPSSIPITLARRLVIYVNSQTSATAYITCLAG